jgi:glycosyltransferase involved in cell wall biosynthesis
VRRRHEEAYRANPIERGWFNEQQHKKALREYEVADTIVVASDYVRDSFLEAGFSEHKLSRFALSPSRRFRPAPAARPEDGVFRIVYVGGLTVVKGIPVLLDAFARFKPRSAELTLVGGCGTHAMRRYLAQRCARDPRVRIVPGDPLPHLHRANVYVHPSYGDGWSYATLEALACGVPAIVTEDTGAKEFIRDRGNGVVVPTGSPVAILEALVAKYRGFQSEGRMRFSTEEHTTATGLFS